MFYFLIWEGSHRCVHFVKMYRAPGLEVCDLLYFLGISVKTFI